MALTSNKNIIFRNLGVAAFDSLPVSASTTIYQSALIGMVSANSNVKHASDVSTITGVGVAATFADNSTGVSGDVNVNVYTSGEFALTVAGTVAYGDAVYVNTDVTVAASGALAVEGVYLGRAMELYESDATKRWILLAGPRKTGYPTL